MKQNRSSWKIRSPFKTYGLANCIKAFFSILSKYSVTSLSIVLSQITLTATFALVLWSYPSQTQPVDPFPRTIFISTMQSFSSLTLENLCIQKDLNIIEIENINQFLGKLIDDSKQLLYLMGSRPENQLPPDLYYNIDEASKYQSNSRIQYIQRQIAERAIQLLNLEPGSLVLDIGCGSGLSGETLTQNGFIWEGIDISRDMLNIASQKNLQGGLWQFDIGQGWKVRPGVFDGAISISTIQWLCVASKRTDNPFKRCCKFFQSLYDSLRIGARAVLQFYPDGKNQLQMITSAAMKSGFTGGLVVDYPNSTRAKKYYLVIEAGVRRNLAIVQVKGKTEEDDQIQEEVQEKQVKLNKAEKNKVMKKKGKKILKRKQIVLKRKQRLRRKGKVIKPDTKYTGRKRKPKF